MWRTAPAAVSVQYREREAGQYAYEPGIPLAGAIKLTGLPEPPVPLFSPLVVIVVIVRWLFLCVVFLTEGALVSISIRIGIHGLLGSGFLPDPRPATRTRDQRLLRRCC